MLQLRFILLLILSPLVLANPELRYAASDHPVAFREGASDQDRSLGYLEANEAVKLLKQNLKTGYARIERSRGETGWVLTRDLKDSPKTPLSDPNGTKNPPRSKSVEDLQHELIQLQTELSNARTAAQDVLMIQAERDQLQSTVIHMRREIETLNQERHVLDADQKQSWFLIGGAVLFGGIFIGIILPRISLRRRNSWGSL